MRPAAACGPIAPDLSGLRSGRRAKLHGHLAHRVAAPLASGVALVDVSRNFGRGDSRVEALRDLHLLEQGRTNVTMRAP